MDRQDQLLQLVTLQIEETRQAKIEQAEAQAKQAETQAKQAETQAFAAERNYNMQIRLEKRVAAFEATVVAKLNNIEKQVLIVKEVVISEFKTMNKSDNENLVELLETALDAPAVVEQIEAIKTGNRVQVRNKAGVFKNKKYDTVTAMQAITAYFGSFVKSEYRKQPGQFIARIMRQVTGIDWQSNYPAEFSEAIATMSYFYQEQYDQPLK